MARPLGPKPKPKRSLLHTRCCRKVTLPNGKVMLWLPPSEAITRVKLLAEDFGVLRSRGFLPETVLPKGSSAENTILRVTMKNGDRLEISYPENLNFVRQVARYHADGTLIDLKAV